LLVHRFTDAGLTSSLAILPGGADGLPAGIGRREAGDLILLVADAFGRGVLLLGRLRLHLGKSSG